MWAQVAEDIIQGRATDQDYDTETAAARDDLWHVDEAWRVDEGYDTEDSMPSLEYFVGVH